MNRAQIVLRHLRDVRARAGDEIVTDREFLQRFLAHQDQEAFGALVRRHGAMVFAVCRSIVGNDSDAEDAFQATFLVLARQAASVRKQDSLASWLHGVALRVASRQRSDNARRRRHEGRVVKALSIESLDNLSWAELQSLLHGELQHLPTRQREVLLLCYWEGLTVDEMASQLGCTRGVVRGLLERGRQRLRQRLCRHGLPVISVLLLEKVMADAAASRLSPSLMQRAATMALAGQATHAASRLSIQALAQAEVTTAAWPLRLVAVLGLLLLGVVSAGWLLTMLPGEPAVAAGGLGAKVGRLDPPNPGQMDAFGDLLPKDAVARLGTIRLRQGTWIHGLSLSPDGTQLVGVGGNRTVRTWDAATGKPLTSFQTDERDGNVRGVAHSPDGRLLALTSERFAGIWDAMTGKPIHRFEDASANAILFAPDGKTVITSGGLQVWSCETGAQIGSFTDPTVNSAGRGGIRAMAYSPTGRMLATTEDSKVLLWDAAERRLRRRSDLHTKHVNCLAFSPDGALIATGSSDHGILLWDVETGDLKRQFQGHTSDVTSVALSPDGKLLLSGSGSIYYSSGPKEQAPVRLWDVATGQELARWGDHTDHVLFAGDGKIAMAAHGSTILRWDVATRRPVDADGVHEEWIAGLAFAPDGSLLASGSADGTVGLWDVKTRKLVRKLPETSGVQSVAFSPNGKLVLTGLKDGSVCIWDVASGMLRHHLAAHESGREARATFTPDGSKLASCSRDGTLKIWDVATQRLVVSSLKLEEGLWCLAISPDGRFLATGGHNQLAELQGRPSNRIRLFEVVSGQEIRQLPLDNLMPMSVAFAPDGMELATVDWSKTVRTWDVAKGQPKRQWQDPDGALNAVAYSPDGKYVATAGYQSIVRVWNATSGKEVQAFTGHVGGVKSLAFAPDGKTLASGSWDTTVLLWDVSGLK